MGSGGVDPEDPDDGLPPRHRAQDLGLLAVAPGRVDAAAPLVVRVHGVGQIGQGLPVHRVQDAAAGVAHEGRAGAGPLAGCVPEFPELRDALLVEARVGLPRRLVGVGLARQLEPVAFPEEAPAVGAVAHLEGAVLDPSVGEDGVHVVEAENLLDHPGHVLEVVRPQAAGQVHLRHHPMPEDAPILVVLEPVRMGSMEVFVGGVGIEAGPDHHAQSAGRLHQLSEGIAVPQPEAPVMERHLRRVVRDHPPGAQAHRVAVAALPEVGPEAHVQLRRVVLDQGELAPAHGPVEPGGTNGPGRSVRSTLRAEARPRKEARPHGRPLQESPAFHHFRVRTKIPWPTPAASSLRADWKARRRPSPLTTGLEAL